MSKPPSAVVLRKKEPEWPGKKPQENCLRQIFLEKLTGHGWEKTFATAFPVWSLEFFAKPFVPDTPFLYLLKTSENRKVCWCFQEVEKGYIGNKWIKVNSLNLAPGILLVFYSWWTYFLVQISFTCTFIFK